MKEFLKENKWYVALVLIIAIVIATTTKFSSSPEEKRISEIETNFSSLDGSHNGLTKYIKSHMNDVNSYEHVETTYTDRGDYIIVKTVFRGNNAFGGKVLNTITARCDNNGNVIEVISQNP